jgi:hypothetical protein
LGEDGRTDLHVVVNEVSHSVEVQLSPIGTEQWRHRDARYRRHADHVTWLYGPSAEAAAAAELALRNVSLALRKGPQIGVRDLSLGVNWVPLEACRLTPAGFRAPGMDEAVALAAQRQAEEIAARRLDEDKKQRLITGQAERLRERRMTAERDKRASWQPPPRPHTRTSPLFPELEPWEAWDALFPEAAFWQPPSGWGWLDFLPEDLHRAARATAYVAQVLSFSSPTATMLPELSDPDEREQILQALENARLIRRYTSSGGVERWERVERG